MRLLSVVALLLRLFWPRRDRSLERGIFRYHDGNRWRHADPLEIDPLLDKHGGKVWPEWLSILNATEGQQLTGDFAVQVQRQREESVVSLVKLARNVFALKTADEGGLVGAECLDVLSKYLLFLVKLRDKFRPLPILPARLASYPADTNTGHSSESGSTANASDANGQRKLPALYQPS